MSDLLPQDAADLAEEARRLLVELDHDVPGAAGAAAECRPPLDVFETADAVEVVVDVPGVPPESLRVAVRRDTVLVVGVKLSPPVHPLARFHLAERSYGHFARAVRLGGAFDANRARAIAVGGQLRVVLPRIKDRRGQILPVPVERG
ncbi:MAG TPA: Hsp20/alpha crystallin family protein [Vicinamibacterales bacterium]|nr:Hsp20/alpha crystallin family protein [Vicinamibacterales bacterium]